MSECPTCGRDDFASDGAMKGHHTKAHGERLGTRCSDCGGFHDGPREQCRSCIREAAHVSDVTDYEAWERDLLNDSEVYG